jgi:hypothetical protein
MMLTAVNKQENKFNFKDLILIDFWCLNATFSNISAISWRPVVEECPERTTNHG